MSPYKGVSQRFSLCVKQSFISEVTALQSVISELTALQSVMSEVTALQYVISEVIALQSVMSEVTALQSVISEVTALQSVLPIRSMGRLGGCEIKTLALDPESRVFKLNFGQWYFSQMMPEQFFVAVQLSRYMIHSIMLYNV